MEDWEDVRSLDLGDEREAELLDRQTECVFMWTNREGAPVGVIMNFVWTEDRLWLTSSARRKRVPAVRRDPRVAVAVTSKGSGIGRSQSLTLLGRCRVHEDRERLAWFYPLLAARVRPGDPERQAAFVRMLDSPNRVVLEVVPTARIGFDSERMFDGTGAGPSAG